MDTTASQLTRRFLVDESPWRRSEETETNAAFRSLNRRYSQSSVSSDRSDAASLGGTSTTSRQTDTQSIASSRAGADESLWWRRSEDPEQMSATRSGFQGQLTEAQQMHNLRREANAWFEGAQRSFQTPSDRRHEGRQEASRTIGLAWRREESHNPSLFDTRRGDEIGGWRTVRSSRSSATNPSSRFKKE